MKIHSQDEFEYLNLKDKIILASLCGIKLATRVEGEYRINLYFLNDYYIEVWRCKKEDEILHVRTFIENKFLDVYLNRIDISELIKQ